MAHFDFQQQHIEEWMVKLSQIFVHIPTDLQVLLWK